MLASLVASTAAATVVVESGLTEGWRGPVDILVTPAESGSASTVSPGFLDPNFSIGKGGGGITDDDLAQIRSVSGVEVAAPLGFLGSYPSEQRLVIALPSPVTDTERNSIRMTLAGAGNSEILVIEDELVLRKTESGSVVGIADRALFQFEDTQSGVAYFVLDGLPEVATSAVVIDVTAEQELLGQDPRGLERLREWDEAFLSGTVPATCDAFAGDALPWPAPRNSKPHGPNTAANCIYGLSAPIVPYVSAAPVITPDSLTLTIERNGTTILQQDLASMAAPFAESHLFASAPSLGGPLAPRVLAKDSQPVGLTPRHYETEERGDQSFELRVSSSGITEHTPNVERLVSEPQLAYRAQARGAPGPDVGPSGIAPLEVGVLDLAAIASGSNAGQPALGAYAMQSTQDSGVADLLDLGPVSGPVNAVMSHRTLESAGHNVEWDVVRVRVDIPAGTGLESLDRIEKIARQIAIRGFDVRVVAGSSETGAVLVDAASGHEITGAVGIIQLHAASLISASLESGRQFLETAAILAVVAALLTGFIATQRDRTLNVRALQVAGLSRRQQLRWMLAENVPGQASLLVVALAAMILSESSLALQICLALFLSIASGYIAAVLAIVEAGKHRPSRSRAPASGWNNVTWISVAAAQLRARWRAIAVQGVFLAFAACAAAFCAVTIPALFRKVGTTELGGFVTSTASLANAVLAGVVAIGFLALLVLATSPARQVSRADEWRLVALAGWASKHLWRIATAREIFSMFIAAIAFSSALSALSFSWPHAFREEDTFTSLAVGIALIVGKSAIAIMTSRWSVNYLHSREGSS